MSHATLSLLVCLQNTMRITLLFLLLAPVVSAAQTFTEVSVESGIDFLPVAPAFMGGGLAWFDYDNDGWQDLYVTGCTLTDRLYHNLQDGTFEEVGEAAGLGVTSLVQTQGVSTADYDRDGDIDVFVTTWRVDGENTLAANLLLRNNGDGTFTDVANEAGVNGAAHSISATWFDANNDGWIDLWVGNYVEVGGFIFNEDFQIVGFDHECTEDYLYENNGDGTFTNLASIYEAQNAGCTLATRATDFDLDNDVDVWVGNDFGEWVIPNKLFRNNYPMALFSEISNTSGTGQGIYSMGIATGDYDRDGDWDYYITNLGRNVLLNQETPGFFEDHSTSAGVENTGEEDLLFTSWATGFADFDHDGWEDLFVANGHIPTISIVDNWVMDPDLLYHNNGDGTFTNIAPELGMDDPGIGRGGALCDYDRDGDLDLVVSNVWNPASEEEEHVRLYRNEQSDNQWIQFELEGTASNPQAIGARLDVFSGNQHWMREVSGGGDPHMSQHARALHVGLGNVLTVDSARVTWPSGLVELWVEPSLGTTHAWIEGNAQSVPTFRQLPATSTHPTPADDWLRIAVPAGGAGVFDLVNGQGQHVLTWNLTDGVQTRAVDHLSAGCYWLTPRNKSRVQGSKVLVR